MNSSPEDATITSFTATVVVVDGTRNIVTLKRSYDKRMFMLPLDDYATARFLEHHKRGDSFQVRLVSDKEVQY